MSKRAEKAIEAYYGNIPDDADKVKAARHFYEQAEKDMIERAAKWWCQRIAYVFGNGLAKNIAEEFKQAMEEE